MLIRRRIFWIFIATALFFIMLLAFQRLLMPKYMSDVYEGRLIGEYYSAEKSNDVIFLGDCEVTNNISPVTLWENFGITSYVRGSPQQLVWHSYYLLEDILRYETPKIVFFSVTAMKHNEPQSEAYNRLTLDGMRLSFPKLRAINAAKTENEDKITYIFPILRFNERWRELTSDDFRYFFGGNKVSFNGYMLRTDIKPADFVPTGPILPGYGFGDNSMDYLRKMTQLCKANNIELILIKTPSLHPYWYEQWDEQIVQYAVENNLIYINTLDLAEEIGLDFLTDTYNGGLSLNVFGAEKHTIFLGNYLHENYELTDHRSNQKLSGIWENKLHVFNNMKNTQLFEIKEYGVIKTFTYKP